MQATHIDLSTGKQIQIFELIGGACRFRALGDPTIQTYAPGPEDAPFLERFEMIPIDASALDAAIELDCQELVKRFPAESIDGPGCQGRCGCDHG